MFRSLFRSVSLVIFITALLMMLPHSRHQALHLFVASFAFCTHACLTDRRRSFIKIFPNWVSFTACCHYKERTSDLTHKQIQTCLSVALLQYCAQSFTFIFLSACPSSSSHLDSHSSCVVLIYSTPNNQKHIV